uniref:Uncharacterized protein n=1 Tax=Sphaeramia orbicularis TaxID=375764 RepID=A0A673A9M9_9TELE
LNILDDFLASGCLATIGDMNICYILDGVLILYGLILTALYCRLRHTLHFYHTQANKPAQLPTFSTLSKRVQTGLNFL